MVSIGPVISRFAHLAARGAYPFGGGVEVVDDEVERDAGVLASPDAHRDRLDVVVDMAVVRHLGILEGPAEDRAVEGGCPVEIGDMDGEVGEAADRRPTTRR